MHKETFIGLVTHFVAHYFHYDSKFWKTLKILLTKPGALTVAYREKKRNRYIPPISLYIFVSVVFFLVFFMTTASKDSVIGMSSVDQRDSIRTAQVNDSLQRVLATGKDIKNVEMGLRFNQTFSTTEGQAQLLNDILHSLPKVLFFLIPFMAFLLKVLYWKRKDTFYVDHAIFSLHMHSFTFIVLFLTLIPVPEKDLSWYHHIFSVVQNMVPFIIFLYLILAIHKVYGTKWLRSGLYGIVISLGYVLSGFVVGIIMFIFYLFQKIQTH